VKPLATAKSKPGGSKEAAAALSWNKPKKAVIYGVWSPLTQGRICTHAVKWKKVRKAVDVQEATADQGACAPWTRGNNCPPVENLNISGGDLPGSEEAAPLPAFENMSKKEVRELTARLRLVKPKRRKRYKQEITDQQRLRLESELVTRGFEGSEKEVDLLLRGGSIPSGAGMRIFYRNERLQEDDKWRQWY
jgi:hypothetical protein